MGVIIPPSLLMIIYGITTETSITDLFKAGWGPGLLLAGALCVYTVIIDRDRPTEPLRYAELGSALADGVRALLMPVILLGGIYSGFFTVTESAAVSVVYALAVEFVIYREMRASVLLAVMLETLKMLGSLMPLIAIAASLNNVLDLEGVSCSSSPERSWTNPLRSWSWRRCWRRSGRRMGSTRSTSERSSS